MSKVKTAYFCQVCGYESAKWTGKCPSCGQWNTMVEELIQKDSKKTAVNDWESYHENNGTQKRTRHLNEIETKDSPRLITVDGELNRVLGGGIVREVLFLLRVNQA